jgi:hypothetical protein
MGFWPPDSDQRFAFSLINGQIPFKDVKSVEEIMLFKKLSAKFSVRNGVSLREILFVEMAVAWNTAAEQAVLKVERSGKSVRRTIFKKTVTQLEAYSKKNLRTLAMKETMEISVSRNDDLLLLLMGDMSPASPVITGLVYCD